MSNKTENLGAFCHVANPTSCIYVRGKRIAASLLWISYSWLCPLTLTQCSSEDHQNIETSQSCISGFRWNPNDVEPGLSDESLIQKDRLTHIGAGEMYPGRSCIGCHAEHNGPKYIVAGTVFAEIDERNDCTGFGGITIEVTDANGKPYTMVSNSVGNFYLPESEAVGFAFPFKAKAIRGEREFAMEDAQDTGDCASCHTATGENDANGRIIVN